MVRHDGRELARTTFEVGGEPGSGEVASAPAEATSAGGLTAPAPAT